MSFEDFKTGQTVIELRQQRAEKLNELASLIRDASRADIHKLLGLPEAIRTRSVDEVSNYRTMLKERLVHQLERSETEIDEGKQELIQQLIDGIDEIDRITAQLDVLKKGPNNEGNGPEGDSKISAA